MDRVTLGSTGLEVSPIAFGTWQLGGDWGPFDEEEAIAAVRFARERGINFFDTAQGYGYGASERLLGRALRDDLDDRRDEIVIATKGGLRMQESGIQVRDSSPEWLREGVRQSLEALGVDHIDIYQLHWPDSETPLAQSGEALAQLVDEGKIGHVGVSNFSPGQMSELARVRPVETLQPPYAMLRREIEADVLPYCAEHEIGGVRLRGARPRDAHRHDDHRPGVPRRRLARLELRVPRRVIAAQPRHRRSRFGLRPRARVLGQPDCAGLDARQPRRARRDRRHAVDHAHRGGAARARHPASPTTS